MDAILNHLKALQPLLVLAMAYIKVVPAYLQATWQTAQYFYEPKLAAIGGGIVLLCLLLRIFIGGIGGKVIRLAVYCGLFYVISHNQEFRLLFPEASVGYTIAAIAVLGLWLPVTLLGGLVRMLRGGGRSSVAMAAGGGGAAAAAGGQPYNVVRREDESKKIQVIMMTDIVGYSAKMEKDEAATFALLKEHNTIMRRNITTHRGKEIKTIGDAFMVVFQSPLEALRCGISMQKDLRAFNKPRPVNDHLKVRIGIHEGEVIVTEKDVFGEGVNIAARMESITDPGGISISAAVYEHVKGKVEAGFQSIGIPKMKNIANPPEVYRVHVT